MVANRNFIRYNCHINLEICSSVESMKYIHKYIYKGHDRTGLELRDDQNRNEVKEYLDAGYIGSVESCWHMLHAQENIALCVASSGIASLLLDSGCTAHSRFHIPLQVSDTSVCNITRNSHAFALLQQTQIIIWDEVPMHHKYAIEAVDRTLQDLLGNTSPFGGITMLFGGDFRQTLCYDSITSVSFIVLLTVLLFHFRFPFSFPLLFRTRFMRLAYYIHLSFTLSEAAHLTPSSCSTMMIPSLFLPFLHYKYSRCSR